MKNEDAKKIVNLLDKAIRRHKRGIITAVNKSVKRGNAWWHQRLKAGDITVGQMMTIVKLVDKNPVLLIREAVGSEDGLELDKPVGEAPEIVIQAWRRVNREKGSESELNESFLATLDLLRYQKPEEAISQAQWGIQHIERSLLPRILGIAGSTWRILLRLQDAEHAIFAGLEIAEQFNDKSAVADLLKRLSYVMAERGDLEAALDTAGKATLLSLRLGDRTDVGKALVDQGLWLSRLGHSRDAIAVQKLALEWLPAAERRYRYSALQILGINHRELGELETAMAYVSEAEELAKNLDSWAQNKLIWLRAKILEDLDEYQEASELMQRVVEHLAPIHLGDMAIAACDLVRLNLLRGEPRLAYEAATGLHMLLEPFRRNKIVSAAVADLLREGTAGLTLALAEQVKAQIEGELKRADIWRLLWATSPSG